MNNQFKSKKIMNKLELNAKMAAAWINAVELKVGDSVQVKRLITREEEAYCHTPSNHFTAKIGDVGEVASLTLSEYGNIQTTLKGCTMPYFVLEKVDVTPKTIEIEVTESAANCCEFTVIVSEKGVTIGCQTYPFETFEKFIRAYKRMYNFCVDMDVIFSGYFNNEYCFSVDELDTIKEAINSFK